MSQKTLKRKAISVDKPKTKKFLNNTLKISSVKIPDRGNKLLDNIVLGKQLGKGVMGTIYLASDIKHNKYAYKIEQVLSQSINKSLLNAHWREIEFAINLANKHPSQFMTLYDWKIDNKCQHRQDFGDISDLPKIKQLHYKRVSNSPYCSIKLWSIIDGTISDIIQPKLKISSNVFYDIFIQIIYIVYLMQSAGYLHNDFHPGNIGYIKTIKKTINILGNEIPTHAYLIKAIDYGLILHKKYKMTPVEHLEYNNNNDLLTVYNLLLLEDKSIKIGKYSWNWFNEWTNIIYDKIPGDSIDKLKFYLPKSNSKMSKIHYEFLIDKLFKILEYEKFQQIVLKDTSIKGVAPEFNIPYDNVLFMISNIYNPEVILKHFITTRNI